jgi:hypothetical protein
MGNAAADRSRCGAPSEVMRPAESKPVLTGALLILYYLFIIVTLIVMYGRGDFSTPPFIYQGF